MISAVIFDMDGVLIDTEPLWREAKKTVFGSVGINVTDDLLRQTMGIRIDEIVDSLYKQYPWKGPSKKQVIDQMSNQVLQLIKKEGKAKLGVTEALDSIKKNNLRLALASVVTLEMINTVLEKLEIKQYFEVIRSAEFEEYGKPHPAVYINTAKELNVMPQFCVAVEDSINGIIAAKAAKMKCIAVPPEETIGDKRLGIADVVISSLLEVNENTLNQINK